MRRKKLFVAVTAACVTGLAAAFLTLSFLGQTPVSPAADGPTAGTVVVAADKVPLGTYLTAQHVKTVAWPSGALPLGYFADEQDVINRGVRAEIQPNEPILESKLAPIGSKGGVETAIPTGMRGVAVKVDEVVSNAGFVLPGSRVDVLVTLNPETESERQLPAKTRVILQNVQVLATGETVERDEEGKPQTVTVITLLVTPEQAEKLTLAATEGRIQMALRNVMDLDSVVTPGVETSELVEEPATAPAPAAPRPRVARPVTPRSPAHVEVILGGKKSVESF